MFRLAQFPTRRYLNPPRKSLPSPLSLYVSGRASKKTTSFEGKVALSLYSCDIDSYKF